MPIGVFLKKLMRYGPCRLREKGKNDRGMSTDQKKMLQPHAVVLYRKWGAAVGMRKRHSEEESNIGTVSGGLEFRHPETWGGAFIGDPEEEE